MADQPDKPRPDAAARAEALRLRTEAGMEATADYLAEAKAVEERTARLRELRLERDRLAAEESARAAAKPAKATKTRSRAARPASGA